MKTETMVNIIEICCICLLLVITGKLSYEEGQYTGMKDICKEKNIYLDINNKPYCEKDIGMANVGIGGNNPEIMFRNEVFLDANEI